MTDLRRAYRERRKAEEFVRIEVHVPKREIELIRSPVKRISDPTVDAEWLDDLKALAVDGTVTDLKALLQRESLEGLDLPDRTACKRSAADDIFASSQCAD